MSLESIVEKAFKEVTLNNQSEISAVPFLLAQETTEDERDLEKVPLPSITLTARCNEEMVPNSGVFSVELTISVTDAAVRQDGIALRLNEIFRLTTRPLLYKTLAGLMTQAGHGGENFKCFGLPERGEANTEEFLPGRVTRTKTALFICSTEIGN